MNNILEKLRGYGELQDGISFDAVVRHPLADETELLKKLGVKKEDCSSCDVIWAFNDELIFISLFSTSATIGKSLVNYKFDEEALFGGNHFFVATEQILIETKHIEKMLYFLSGWLTAEGSEIIKLKSPELNQISDKDICK